MKLAFNETTQDYDLLEDADAADPDITKGYADGGYKIVPVTDAQVAEIKAKPDAAGRALKAASPFSAGESPVVGPAGFAGRILREGLVDAGGAAAGAAAGSAIAGPIGTIPGGIIGALLTAGAQGALDATPGESRVKEGVRSGVLELLTGGIGSILGKKVGKVIAKTEADEGVKKAASNVTAAAEDAPKKRAELIREGGKAKSEWVQADEALKTLRYEPGDKLKELQKSYVDANSRLSREADMGDVPAPTLKEIKAVAQKIRNGEEITDTKEKAIQALGAKQLLDWLDSVENAAKTATKQGLHPVKKAEKEAEEAAIAGSENVAAKKLREAKEAQNAPGIAPKTAGAVTGGVGGILRSAMENIKQVYKSNIDAPSEELDDRYQRELAVNIGKSQEEEQTDLSLRPNSNQSLAQNKQDLLETLQEVLDEMIANLVKKPGDISLQKDIVDVSKQIAEIEASDPANEFKKIKDAEEARKNASSIFAKKEPLGQAVSRVRGK